MKQNIAELYTGTKRLEENKGWTCLSFFQVALLTLRSHGHFMIGYIW